LLQSPAPSTSHTSETGTRDVKELYGQFHELLRPVMKIFKIYYRQNKSGAAPHVRKVGPLKVRCHHWLYIHHF
jgi:hypothetical protein